MYHDLSKREKKIARICIVKGLEEEFRDGLSNFDTIISEWREGKFATNKDAYHQLFKAITKKDKAIARRYDGLTGSSYFITVAAIFHDGFISEDDVKDFSEETRLVIDKLIHIWKNE